MADQVESSKLTTMQVLLVLGIFALGVLLGYLALTVIEKNGGPEVLLPLLAIGGLLALLVVLAMVSVFFQTIGLSDKAQPLALPEGSVRAVIALSLIVLFAILSVYLYATLGKVSLDRVTEAQRTQLLQDGSQIISSIKTDCPAGTPTTAGGTAATCYSIVYRARNTVGEDFAKQLLVMLGTLVTAVASFYFGANSVASAQSAMADALKTPPAPGGGMSVQGLVPPSTKKGGSVPLTISGRNLEHVAEVKAVLQGTDTTIKASDVVPKANTVTCTLDLSKPAAAAGNWDIILSDAAGNQPPKPVVLKVTDA